MGHGPLDAAPPICACTPTAPVVHTASATANTIRFVIVISSEIMSLAAARPNAL